MTAHLFTRAPLSPSAVDVEGARRLSRRRFLGGTAGALAVPALVPMSSASAATVEAIDGSTVYDAAMYATINDAVAAANAHVGGNAVLWLGATTFTSVSHLTIGPGVSVWGQRGGFRFTAPNGGLNIPEPDSSYVGFTVDGNDVAHGYDPTDLYGTGADALLKVGTQAGGSGAKAYFANVNVRRVGAGGTCVAFHNLQNSDIYDLRTNDSIAGSIGVLIDNGCKNVNFFGIWPTSCSTAVKITTSAGTQRTSKINFWGGLTELSTVTAFRLEDCEQVLIENVAMNGSGSAGVHCVAGGNRAGGGAKGPSAVSVFGCQFQGPASAIQVDTATVVHVGALSPAGCAQTYKVETRDSQTKIIETRPNFSEGTVRFASVVGAIEQTVVQRHTPPTTVTIQGDCVAWPNMPAALTELHGTAGQRMWVDASRYLYARLVGNVVTPGATGSKLRLMYRTSNGSFSAFSSAGTTDIQLPIDATGAVRSPWVALAAGAKADVVFAVGGASGNGSADPVIGSLAVEFH